MTNFEFYYNNVPGQGLCRNNLIYTSLISSDKKTFCQWYHNDTEYHQGQHQVIDPTKLEEKYNRELHYLQLMYEKHPELVPHITDIDLKNKKIYLAIDGVDFWQRSLDGDCSFDKVLPDWQDQMLAIIQTHKNMGLYKYSMHPSSYFIIDGKLKNINYFFAHHEDEGDLCLRDYESHIYSTRQAQMKEYVAALGISWDTPEPQTTLQILCFDSFRTNYPADFIDKAKKIYEK